MTAPTTHWSTTGRLHTGTVAGCGACEAEFDAAAEARYRAMIGADLPREVRAERARANREKARESDSLPPRNDLQAESVSLPLRADDDAGETRDAQEGAQ